MNKKWLVVVGLVSVMAVFGLTACDTGSISTGEIASLKISNQQDGIWVTGQGEVSAAPDIAILSLGIEAEDESVAKARDLASVAMNEVMDALLAAGIVEKDIQTQYFSIQQTTRWDGDKQENIVTGYSVTNTVTVTIRNIDNVGTVIDSVADAGGDLTRVNNISFSIDEPAAYYEEARKEAMENAKDIAEQLAELSGVSLGNVNYISESSYYAPVATRAGGLAYDEAAGYSTKINPGELDISISIQVSYDIK
jgi:uncharacterized protein